VQVKVATRTEVGLVRDHNEDDLLVDEEHRLFIVADGLGGHVAGEVASRTAVRAAHTAVVESMAEDPARALPEALHIAHEAVIEDAVADPGRRGMGTTAVLAQLSPDDQQLWVAHVGDSRAYLLRSGQLHRLTTDHRVGGGSLTQALGTSDEIVPDVSRVDLEPGDRVLLCTDGLTDMIGDDDIAGHLPSGEPEQGCDRLVDAAMARGGVDNITLVLIEINR
jgi:serine/threonine protein phosphatase PrpC